jgi:predicted metal-dependent hydrolase
MNDNDYIVKRFEDYITEYLKRVADIEDGRYGEQRLLNVMEIMMHQIKNPIMKINEDNIKLLEHDIENCKKSKELQEWNLKELNKIIEEIKDINPDALKNIIWQNPEILKILNKSGIKYN